MDFKHLTGVMGSKQFFGHYGKVTKIIQSIENDQKNQQSSKSISYYVTYQDQVSAACAILSIDKTKLNHK